MSYWVSYNCWENETAVKNSFFGPFLSILSIRHFGVIPVTDSCSKIIFWSFFELKSKFQIAHLQLLTLFFYFCQVYWWWTRTTIQGKESGYGSDFHVKSGSKGGTVVQADPKKPAKTFRAKFSRQIFSRQIFSRQKFSRQNWEDCHKSSLLIWPCIEMFNGRQSKSCLGRVFNSKLGTIGRCYMASDVHTFSIV